MEGCDVLIVGGGPAGSACAQRLRRHGLDVLVLDRSRFPRDKVCAGWITPAVVDALALDVEDYTRHRVLQPIGGFRTGRIGGRSMENRYGAVVSYGIRRCEFDDYLLRRSEARLRLGEPVEHLVREGPDWVVNGNIRAPMLVGAGGHTCPVARHLGASLGSRIPAVVAREAEFPLEGGSCGVRGDTPELYFCADLKGYGWCFRKGDWLNVGLGREDSQDVRRRLGAFCDWLYRRGRIPPIPEGLFKGHSYLLYGHGSRPFAVDAAVLIGDAAGLAYPRSGEGIGPAVESGLMAADVIAAAKGDYSAVGLRGYADQVQGRYGPLNRPHRARAMPLGRLLGRLVLSNAPLTRRLVLDPSFLHR